MRHEIIPAVFAHVDGIRSLKPKRTKTEIIELAGVRDAREKAADWAWALAGDGYLLTIWCEGIRIHPETGRWYYVDSFSQRRRNGQARGPLQGPRADFRVECLRELNERKAQFTPVLQVNAVRAELLDQGEDSEVDFRVRDDAPWHVASANEGRDRLILVRGKPGWMPSEEDIEGRNPADGEAKVEPKLAFPDQAHRDLVESIAIEVATAEYKKRGLVVNNVDRENRGYDLEVNTKEGRPAYHVEVKGTASSKEGFFLTRNERRRSAELPTWRLAIVTSALTTKDLEIYRAEEMEERFGFAPLVWRCDPK